MIQTQLRGLKSAGRLDREPNPPDGAMQVRHEKTQKTNNGGKPQMLNVKGYKREILATASALAMIGLAGVAHAQTTTPVAVEEVVVTGSRIARVGFIAPTPVTAVTSEQIKATAPNDIADSLATVPAFRGASARSVDNGSGSSNGNAGASLLSLRGLGSTPATRD
jgi:hypothetical protein